MDFQEKFKTQTENPLFKDGRSMRYAVAGTIPSGELKFDDHFNRGLVDGSIYVSSHSCDSSRCLCSGSPADIPRSLGVVHEAYRVSTPVSGVLRTGLLHCIIIHYRGSELAHAPQPPHHTVIVVRNSAAVYVGLSTPYEHL